MVEGTSTRESSQDLPRFTNPPVVETVLGVQFYPLPGISDAHWGAFWKSLGKDWPTVNNVAPLEPQYEQFGEQRTWRTVGLQLKQLEKLNSRFQIRSQSNDRMIQVQNGRFHYNWLGHGSPKYPAFDQVKPEFDSTWTLLQQFVAQEALGELRPNQWEVTYVNQIPKGTLWNEAQDWVGLFPSLTPLPAKMESIQLDSFGGEWHYEIKPRLGRLHVNLSHGWLAKPDEQEILVLKLTARGPVTDEQEGGTSLDEGVDLGHETIVRAFRDLSSAKAHKHWGLDNG